MSEGKNEANSSTPVAIKIVKLCNAICKGLGAEGLEPSARNKTSSTMGVIWHGFFAIYEPLAGQNNTQQLHPNQSGWIEMAYWKGALTLYYTFMGLILLHCAILP